MNFYADLRQLLQAADQPHRRDTQRAAGQQPAPGAAIRPVQHQKQHR